MARILPIMIDQKNIYQIVLTRKFEMLPQHLKELGYCRKQKICIVTDSVLEHLYGEEVTQILEPHFDRVIRYNFPTGENYKNLTTVQALYEYLIKQCFNRNDFLIALGGGVVGDLTGFVAATYLRGIDFIQVPTTLLAQVDSSIGGKTGVDVLQYKNMAGAFYHPKLVYTNLETLCSLPKRHIIAGLGEVIKHGLIKDADYIAWIQGNAAEIASLNLDFMEELIFQSCQIKRAIVEKDPTEKGERVLLNFGHTIGHAIEKVSNFRLYHGECVALGILAACHLSKNLGFICQSEFSQIEAMFYSLGFQMKIEEVPPKDVLFATKSDKKMTGNSIKFILLKAIGEAYINKELTESQILDAICYVCI